MKTADGSALIHKKWMIRTTDERFHHNFRAKVCTANHEHARIEGSETPRSAYYPLKMVQAIVRHWLRELVPLRHIKYLSATQNIANNEFDDEDGNWTRRESPLQDIHMNYHHLDGDSAFTTAPLTPAASQPQALLQSTSSRATQQSPPQVLPANSTGNVYAQQVARPDDPPAPDGEPPDLLADVDPDEAKAWEAKLHRFHRAAGHPTNRNLIHLFRDAQLPPCKIEMAKRFKCASCDALRPGGASSGLVPPAATHQLYRAWQAVGMDVSEWIIPSAKTKVKFLLMMDLATRLRVIHIIKCYDTLQMQSESTEDIIRGFAEKWLADKPKPEILIPDNALTMVSKDMGSFLSDVGIQLAPPAEKESWAHGQIESAMKDVKMTASAIQLGAPAQDPIITLHLAIAALNSTEYVKGYSSFQWCYGKDYSITDEDMRTLSALPESPGSDFSRLVQLRQSAEDTARRTRALRIMSKLNNTTVRQPLRTFHPMQLVMVWRKQWPASVHSGKRGGHKKSGKPHWVGPGRVVFHEVLPHQRGDDERRHIVWVLLQNQLLRCSVHSVRPTTSLEQTEFEINNKEDISQWRSLTDILPRKEYVDLSGDEPLPGERELPDLPDSPNKETVYVPKRRVRQKSALAPDNRRLVSAPSGDDAWERDSDLYAPTSPDAEPPALPSDLEDDLPVNAYEPDSKKARTAEDDQLLHELKSSTSSTTTKESRDYDLHWLQELQQQEGDLHHLFMQCEDVMQIELDVDLPSHRQQKSFESNASAFMVKKMRDSEVVLAKLSNELRELFNRAKSKEVSSFIKAEAVRKALNDEEVRKAFGSGRIMRARWVLTWKLTPPEDIEEAKREAATNKKSPYTKDGLRKAKARIVLLGYERPDLLRPEFKTASPVQSHLGRNLLYLMACVHNWPLEGLDLATAFLQTQPTEADQNLWTHGVAELRDALGLGPNDVMKILKNIYGSTTAPRGLWLDLHKRLASIGGTPLVGERCIWIWLSKIYSDSFGVPKVLGLMGGHVDDFHRISDPQSQEWAEIVQRIDKLYDWGMLKRGTYRHAGTDVHAFEGNKGRTEITLSQQYYIETVPDLDIPPDRLRQENALMTADDC